MHKRFILFSKRFTSKVEVNDLIHVLAELETDGTYLINDHKGLIIINPQHILSGTNVTSSLSCLRK